MKISGLIIILLFCFFFADAQESDSLRIKNVTELQEEIDSLKEEIKLMNRNLQEVKEDLVDNRKKADEFIDLLDADSVDEGGMNEDQRSRRKRVDDLLRAIRQQPGQLRFNGGLTSSFQGNPRGQRDEITAVGSFDIYAMTSFGKGTLLFIDLEAIGGNGPDDLYDSFLGLNGDAGSYQDEDGVDRLNVLEGWAEFSVLNEAITITAGKIDLTNYFDNNAIANDETLQFLSGAFINNAAFVAPSNSPGVRFQTTVLKRFYFQVGLVSMDNAGAELVSDLYKATSLRFRLFANSPWETNFRFYGYQCPEKNSAQGYGISVDGTAFEEYKIFGRYGMNRDALAQNHGISSSWSAGFSFIQQLENKGVNIGLAYGEITPFHETMKIESQFEIYARYQFNKWIYTSPHFQMVWNARGTNSNYSLVGLRTHFNF